MPNNNVENKLPQYEANIEREKIQSLDSISFPGKIIVVNSVTDADEAVDYLNNFTMLGFDTETKPSFRKGKKNKMAILQLASNDRAYLFRLHTIGIPDSLAKLLENGDIKKIGAAVHDDIKGLAKTQNFTPNGFIDLQKIVHEYGIIDKSVQKIAAIVLNVRVSKSQRLTNWENQNLTESQKLYAATDAWVCLKIYEKLTASEG